MDFGPTFAFLKVVSYTEHGSWQCCRHLDLNPNGIGAQARGQMINVRNCGKISSMLTLVEQKIVFEIFIGFSPWWWQSTSSCSLSFYASFCNPPNCKWSLAVSKGCLPTSVMGNLIGLTKEFVAAQKDRQPAAD